MYKASIELFRIHSSCKVRFGLIVKDDNPDKFGKLINKFNFSGNDYIKITPFPFITVDITSKMDKNEEWNSNRTFNLNRRELYIFIGRLQHLYDTFIREKSLFYYDDNHVLQVNKTLALKFREYAVCGNKTILMQACVVENEENHELYEGIFISVNSMDYFTYLTHGELGYFLYELKRINMSDLTMQIINTVYLMEEMEKTKMKLKSPIQEQKEEEIIDVKKRIRIEEESTIPEI